MYSDASMTRTPRWYGVTPLMLAVLVLLSGGLAGCGGDASSGSSRGAENTLSLDVDDTLTDTTYTLINQDSATVAVPDAFLGRPVLMGFIYTRCPNVCPQITANMKQIRTHLDSTAAAGSAPTVQFVSVTFDPRRDTPARLAAYREQFDLQNTDWQFLTGDRATLDRFLDRLGVRRRVKGTDQEFAPADSTEYIFRHSNQLTLIDEQGRVRAEYSGSQTPPSLIARDLEKIQS